MPTATYVPLATTTLGSAANNITFSSIPGGYTDIRLVLNIPSFSGTGWSVGIQFNSDSANDYSYTYLNGTGAAASGSSTNFNQILMPASLGGSTTLPILITADIMSYANTSVYKSLLFTSATDENGGSGSGVETSVGLWRSTSAITTLSLSVYNTSTRKMNAGTTATLWGI
jgi:hypothetical protein